MFVGVVGNNPGRIPMHVSPLRGEVKLGDKTTKEHCEELIVSYPSKYKRFASAAWGYRAMFLIVHNYCEIYNINTLRRIIGRWCRYSDVDPAAFALATANRLGIGINSHIDTLDHDVMTTLIASISKVENGVPAIAADVERGWELFYKCINRK